MFQLQIVVLFFALLLTLVRCQDGFGYGFNSGIQQRDPRGNTGPILFPPPPGDNGQTSGVVVGASGYGFVPPNQGNNKEQEWKIIFISKNRINKHNAFNGQFK